ncbi:T-complex protein 11-domain-containing protein [Phycomyces blakesleeanus]|uniref:T-complex protein 11-domain-containing protein n=1 Tax=Phycomyces blakesleeanus TaxID=4837 RepID=A0ABR3BEG3_PHYBL
MQKSNSLQLSTENITDSSDLLRELTSYENISHDPMSHLDHQTHPTTGSNPSATISLRTFNNRRHATLRPCFRLSCSRNPTCYKLSDIRHLQRHNRIIPNRPCLFFRKRILTSYRFIGVRGTFIRRRWINRRRRHAHLYPNSNHIVPTNDPQPSLIHTDPPKSPKSPIPRLFTEREVRRCDTQDETESEQLLKESSDIPCTRKVASVSEGIQPKTNQLLSEENLLQSAWVPPINSDTLEELTITDIFANLQLRHDMVFDPTLSFRPNLDGSPGREKRRKSDRYWARVDRALQSVLNPASESLKNGLVPLDQFEFLAVILDELVQVIIPLSKPFACSSASPIFPWNWPKHIREEDIVETLDSMLIIQQIRHNKGDFGNQLEFLNNIFEPLCPSSQVYRIQFMNQFFFEGHVAKAFRQCFSILEAVKLECANKALRQYRAYLINTCPEFEWRCFMKDSSENELDIESIYRWFKMTWERQGLDAEFLDVYYEGLIHLVTDDTETSMALGFPPAPFPVTLRFDKKRLTHLFRYEFQNIIVTSILLIPYRYLAGSYENMKDIVKLKRLFNYLLQGAFILTSPDAENAYEQAAQGIKDGTIVSCHSLALHACNTAIQTHLDNGLDDATKSTPNLDLSQLPSLTSFWGEWLSHNLRPGSPIYMLMYRRICKYLKNYARYGRPEKEEIENGMILTGMTGLEDEIKVLGQKLKIVAELNLDTFISLYSFLAKFVKQDILSESKNPIVH